MSTSKPDFAYSPYFVPEDGNWHLKDGAPAEVVEEFNEYMRYERELEKEGIDV